MLYDLEKVSRSSFRVSLNDDAVARLESTCPDEIVGVRLVRSSASARVRLDLCLFRLSIMDESEALSLKRKERQSIL